VGGERDPKVGNVESCGNRTCALYGLLMGLVYWLDKTSWSSSATLRFVLPDTLYTSFVGSLQRFGFHQ
jgi:hypothetical protein